METKKGNIESMVLNIWPDVGQALNLSRATTYSLVKRGVIPSIRLGKRILVPRKALEELVGQAKGVKNEI
jgi:excisionase family DNA binding protein